MTKVIGIRDLVRNSALLEKYDYVEIEDKRTKKLKGLFISPKYADDFKKFLEEKKAQEQRIKMQEIEKFAGSIEIEDRFKNLSYKEIEAVVAKEKYAK